MLSTMEIDAHEPRLNRPLNAKVWDVFGEVIPHIAQFSSEPTTCSLAKAFSRPEITPLHVYRAASHLPERVLREVVQLLTFERSSVAPTAARLLSIMRGLPGNLELAFMFFENHVRSFNSFDPRTVTFFAFICGPLLLNVCDWGPIIQKAVTDNCAESKLALSCLFDVNVHEPIEPVTHIYKWDSESEYAREPSFWRELRWASYTRFLACSSIPTTLKTSQDLKDGVVSSLPISFGNAVGHYVRICENLFPCRSTTTNGTSKPRKIMDGGSGSNQNGFHLRETVVITESVQHAIEELSDFLAYGVSFVLEGPTGCGKTTILSYLARETLYAEAKASDYSRAPGVTFVQMDNAMVSSDGDSFTSLVGEIVPLPEGGGFTWRPGPIGLAAQKGDWLVFENMTRGDQNMTSALAVLLQLANAQPGDSLDAPGRGEPIPIAKGFRCIATRSTSQRDADDSWEPPGGWKTWRRVRMQGLSATEKVELLQKRFTTVQDCVERVVAMIDETSHFIDSCMGSFMKRPTMREAIRVCNRLEATKGSFGALTVEDAVKDSHEVLGTSCNASFEQDEVLKIISRSWSMSPEVARDLCFKYRPTVSRDQDLVSIGRASYRPRKRGLRDYHPKLAINGHTSRLLEIALRSLQMNEHVLLVGEAGSGKTSVIQELASLLNQELLVVNLSRQSDIGDLIGGFKPVEFENAIPALGKRFEHLFCKVMSREKNIRFLDALQRACISSEKHERAIRLMTGAIKAFPIALKKNDQDLAKEWDAIARDLAKLNLSMSPAETIREAKESKSCAGDRKGHGEPPRKRPRPSQSHDENIAHKSLSQTSHSNKGRRRMEFTFSEGVLVKAMREGKWILLDEINLAPSELLERLVSVMDSGEVALGNETSAVISQAPGFFLFGAMNPPTDVGKRYLPQVLRARFSEIYVGDMTEREDIVELTMARFFRFRGNNEEKGFVKDNHILANDVTSFYIQSSSLAREGSIEDNMGRPVKYSIRTFVRMLDFATGVRPFVSGGMSSIRRVLYEGALLAFCSALPVVSRSKVMHLARCFILGVGDAGTVSLPELANMIPITGERKNQFRIVEGFPIEMRAISETENESPKYIISAAVSSTLKGVCRTLIIGAPPLPILLQGPTAAGKTSLVAYLASLTGNKLIRINNHEHTDLSEYLGGYVATNTGSLVFSEGPLVKAARNGFWVLLDELNLAPPDVLESLNRLLDDNREIFIPETGERVKAASTFRLFATQNPPGLYGGRKELSKAFRSRFVEIGVEDLPDGDLLFILEKLSGLPHSFIRKMVGVMRELQVKRKLSGLFSGREGFVTARDLFRWASRDPRSKEELAIHGFFLLGERCRLAKERDVVRNVIIKHTGASPEVLKDEILYSLGTSFTPTNAAVESLHRCLGLLSLTCDHLHSSLTKTGIALTPLTRRILTLVIHCVANNEPVLLVGATGGGKTTACSAICDAMSQKLLTLNCHRHTESSDLLGGFRPVRSRSQDKGIFEWCDGPLVQAMRQGSAFLVDEINMAEDAVIERLNSVLEHQRSLLLSERGAISNVDNSNVEPELIQSHPSFRILATMNPGGDYGKRELSPALRNRFTEVWIPRPDTLEDFAPIVENRFHNLLGVTSSEEVGNLTKMVLQFLEQSLLGQWGGQRKIQSTGIEQTKEMGFHVSLRDLRTWCDFVVSAVKNCAIHPVEALMHGSRVVFLDGLSVGNDNEGLRSIESRTWFYLLSLASPEMMERLRKCRYDTTPEVAFESSDMQNTYSVKVGKFLLLRNSEREPAVAESRSSRFCFRAPGTKRNIARLTRTLAVTSRPILLEGPPGSGKSSLINALADLSGNHFIRINLSESTEISDLIGTDAPGSVEGSFRFQEGPLLTAMKRGSWVLLDELNLASQSVLEGLNSLLDHRKTIFVPETNEAVAAQKLFRFFGAQNPVHGGGGRRGLPKSFLNRFTRVMVDAPTSEDILCIMKSIYQGIPDNISNKIVRTLTLMTENKNFKTENLTDFGLRDALRWCDVLCGTGSNRLQNLYSGRGVFDSKERLRMSFDVSVLQGLRKGKLHEVAEAIFESVFGFVWRGMYRAPSLKAAGATIRVGYGLLRQLGDNYCIRSLEPLSGVLDDSQLRSLQAMVIAVEAGWPLVLLSGAGVSADNDGQRLIEFLGMSSGKKIVSFHGSSFVDAETLIGGYAQRGGGQCVLHIVATAQELLRIMIKSLLRRDQTIDGREARGSLVAETQECYMRLFKLYSNHSEQRGLPGNLQGAINSHDTEEFASAAEGFVRRARMALQKNENALEALNTMACNIIEVRKIVSQQRHGSPLSFEWKKSELVKAIERGDWVFIQSAELCPPAVLDRLNPLFERPPVSPEDLNNSLVVERRRRILLAEAPTEEGGSPMFMIPHPDFRIFFAVSGYCSFSEAPGLSRPLLDRSLRICLDNIPRGMHSYTLDSVDTYSSKFSIPAPHSRLSKPIRHEKLPEATEFKTVSESMERSRSTFFIASADFVLYPELACLDIDLGNLDLMTLERETEIEAASRIILPSVGSILNEITHPFEGHATKALNLTQLYEKELFSSFIQAILLASSSPNDMFLRVRYMNKTKADICFIADPTHENVSETDGNELQRILFPDEETWSFPCSIDPFYAMDRLPTDLTLRGNDLSPLRKLWQRASLFRGQILAFNRFKVVWKSAISLSRPKSVLAQARLKWQLLISTETRNEANMDFDVMCFELLNSAANNLESFRRILSGTDGWEHPFESEVFEIYDVLCNACEVMMKDEVKTACLWALLQNVARVGEKLVMVTDGDLLGFNVLRKLIPRMQNLEASVKWLTFTPKLSLMPRSLPAQLVEKRLWDVLELRMTRDLSPANVDMIVRAISTLSSSLSEGNLEITNKMASVTDCIDQRHDSNETLVWNQALSCFLSVVRLTALDSMQSCLVSVLESPQRLTPGYVISSNTAIESLWSIVRCFHFFNSETLVAIKRFTWSLNSPEIDFDNVVSGKNVDSTEQDTLLLALLREMNDSDQPRVAGDSTENIVDPDPLKATIDFLRHPQRYIFWNLGAVYYQAAVTSGVFALHSSLCNAVGAVSLRVLLLATRSVLRLLNSKSEGKEIVEQLAKRIYGEEEAHDITLRHNCCNDKHRCVESKVEDKNPVLQSLSTAAKCLSAPETEEKEEEDLRFKGTAWLAIGVLRLDAYLNIFQNTNNIDPSEYAEKRALLSLKTKTRLEARRTAYRRIQENRLGGDEFSSSIPAKAFCNRLQEEEDNLKTCSSCYVYRNPDEASFESYVCLVRGVKSNIVESIKTSGFIHRAKVCKRSHLSRLVPEASHLMYICKTMGANLAFHGSLFNYRDLSLRLRLGIEEIKHGLRLLLHAAQVNELCENLAPSRTMHVLSDLCLIPRSSFKNAIDLPKALSQCAGIASSGRALMITAKFLLENDSFTDNSALTPISEFFSRIVKVWKASVMRSETEARRKDSLHIIRQASQRNELETMSVVEVSEEQELEDFISTFNPISDEVEDQLIGSQSEKDDNDLEKVTDDDPRIHSREDLLEISSSDFWNLHQSVFPGKEYTGLLQRRPSVQPRAETLLSFASNLSVLIPEEISLALGNNVVNGAWGLLCSYSVTQSLGGGQSCLRKDDPGSNRNSQYNFYKDSNIQEVQNASRALLNLKACIEKIQRTSLKENGNHPVLDGIVLAIDGIARVTHSSTPLSVVVIGLENVLRKADEWNRLFASRETKLSAELVAVSKLVSLWRRIEMDSWPLLLAARKGNFEAQANKWTFFIYDAVIEEFLSIEKPEDDQSKTLLSTIDQFLRSSPCGEFRRRLEIIQSISYHLLSIDDARSDLAKLLGRSLQGICRLYAIFGNHLEKQLFQQYETILQELKEFARIVSYNPREELGSAVEMSKGIDKNLDYFRLKALSEKTRRRIHKLCLKVDTILRVPFYKHMTDYTAALGFADPDMFSDVQNENPSMSPMQDYLAVLKTSGRNVQMDNIATKSKHALLIPLPVQAKFLTRIDTLRYRIVSYGREILVSSQAKPDVESKFAPTLRNVIRSRLKKLRELKSGTDIQPKRRALVDLLKGLSKAGLSPFEKPHVNFVTDWLSCGDPSSCESYNREANRLYFSGIHQYQTLRSVSDSSTRNNDITSEEASRIRAYCRDLLEKAAIERKELNRCSSVAIHFSKIADSFLNTDEEIRVQEWESLALFTHFRALLLRLRKAKATLRQVSHVMKEAQSCISSSINAVQRDRALDKLLAIYGESGKDSLQELETVLNACCDVIEDEPKAVGLMDLDEDRYQELKYFDGRYEKWCDSIRTYIFRVVKSLQHGISRAQSISKKNIVTDLLSPMLSLLEDNEYEDVEESLSFSSPRRSHESVRNSFSSSSDKLVEIMLISSQKVMEWNGRTDHAEQTKVGETPLLHADVTELFPHGVIRRTHHRIANISSLLLLTQVRSAFETNTEALKTLLPMRCVLSVSEATQLIGMHKAVGLILKEYLNYMLLPTIERAKFQHHQNLALLRTLTSVFIGICKDGFCRPAPEEETEGIAETELKNGTGFGDVGDGDLSGAQDVSEEIEDEEQLLGLRDDGVREPQDMKGNNETEDGFEMTNDFQGDLQDVENTEEYDEEGDVDAEKQMGQDHEEGVNKLNEKLWDSDHDQNDEHETEFDSKQDIKDSKTEANGLQGEWAAGDRNEERELNNTQEENRNEEELSVNSSMVDDETKEDSHDKSEKSKDPDIVDKGTPKSKEDEFQEESRDLENNNPDHDSGQPQEVGEKNREGTPEDDTNTDVPGMDVTQSQENPKMREDDDQDVSDMDSGDCPMVGVKDEPEDCEHEQTDKDHLEDLPLDCGLPNLEEEGNINLSDQNDSVDENLSPDPTGTTAEEPKSKSSPPTHSRDKGIDIDSDPEQGGDISNETDFNEKRQASGNESRERNMLPGLSTTRQADNVIDDNTEAFAHQGQGTFGFENTTNNVKPEHNETSSKPRHDLQSESGQQGNTQNGAGERLESSSEQIEKQKKGSTSLDTNPLRISDPEDLITEWDKYLKALRDENEHISKQTERETGGDTWEFETTDAPNENHQYALGAACEEQQHPLPEEEVADLSNENVEGQETETTSRMEHVVSRKEQDNLSHHDKSLMSQDSDQGRQNLSQEDELKLHPARAAVDGEYDSSMVTSSKQIHGDETHEKPDFLDRLNEEDIMKATGERVKWRMETLTSIEAKELWHALESKVASQAATLCEQLRLVLEPTQASRMAGGYRTGKRLNMRKVIEYVASDFRRDRIWLRRVKPDKRSYDVLVAIDDSASMVESEAGAMATESLALVLSALAKLEVGRIAVASFGSNAKLIRRFDEPLPITSESGARLLQHFTFSQSETNIVNLLSFVHSQMGLALSESALENLSLAFIISDGRLSDREEVRRQLRKLKESNILVAFFVLDRAAQEENSIFNVQRVEYETNGKMSVKPYMYDFPIDFYAVVQDMRSLPGILADALRQWIEATNHV